MMDVAQKAVREALQAGADQADARVGRISKEDLVLRNGALAEASAPDDFGLGVRVIKDGCWGFAAAPGNAKDLMDVAPGLARRAVKAARDLAATRVKPVSQAPETGQVAEWMTPVEEDPFAVSLADKIELLHSVDAQLQGCDETVAREVGVSLRREEQWQASGEGAALHQILLRTGAGLSSTARANGTVQRRSYPASFGGNYQSGGWEVVRKMDLVANARRIRDEARALCFADRCPAGERTLILGGSQLCLQIHESVGHPTELDRVFGHEVDLAGSSFAMPDLLGSRYGAERVNLIADSTVPGGLDTRGFDDDGVASQRWPIVNEGIFSGYLTSREWAHKVGDERSRGCSRAESWYDPPIVRITNLSLMPGSGSLDELLASTEDGAIFADTVRSWSIDQRRLNFQFTSEIAYEVQGGKLGRMLRQPTYQGSTPDFWRSCDAICGPEAWELWGVPNCGKGNPMQVAEMSHGAAPARFRDVTFVN